MKRRHLYSSTCELAVLALVLLAATADRASAAAILVDDLRVVSVTTGASGETDTDFDTASDVPSAPFAPFVGLVSTNSGVPGASAMASAAQTSTVTPTQFTGNGEAQVEGVSAQDGDFVPGAFDARAASEFVIFFDLTTPHEFVLTGALVGPGAGLALSGDGVALQFSGTDTILETGTLNPGSYLFDARAFSDVLATDPAALTESASFIVNFALTEVNGQVPEPGALLLLMAGVAGVVAIKRIRR